MGTSLISFMLLDIVKVQMIRSWSFEGTAVVWPVPSRRAKLALRRGRKIIHERVHKNFEKVKKVLLMCDVICVWKNARAAKLLEVKKSGESARAKK